MWIFNKKEKADPYAIAKEKYKTSFGLLEKSRFLVEEAEDYSSRIKGGRLVFELNRKNIFAWVIDDIFRYDDFCLEAEIEFDLSNPYSSMGFVFRYINDENFYYFLLSSKGYFRFDTVFNKNPLTCIEWTENPLIKKGVNFLRIIAHGDHFSFYIDDDWIAEYEDETLRAGKIGFAAQNYDEGEAARFYLKNFTIESREEEVEREFQRWMNVVPQEPEYRIKLAQTFYLSGKLEAAAVEMRRFLKSRKANADEHFLAGEILTNMQLYDLALQSFEKALELEPEKKEVMQNKANLFYLRNDFLVGRNYIREIISRFEDNPAMWNLLGNCEYSLGNFDKALEAYDKAYRLNPKMPIFRINGAHCLDMLKRKGEAITYYIEASRTLFKQENYDELYGILPRIESIDPENLDVKALKAKLLFYERNYADAEKIIDELVRADYPDSAVYFLKGIILSDNDHRDEALDLFRKATEREDEYAPYWFKWAETLYLLKKDRGEIREKLDRAHKLDPEDPWTMNLYGLLCMEDIDYKKAIDYFRKAFALAGDQPGIAINLSDALYKDDQKDEAFTVLDREEISGDPGIMNQRGNLFSRLKNYTQAVEEYEKAIRLSPKNPVFIENCARACLEIDMIHRAEELSVMLLDSHPTPGGYDLIGRVAFLKSELSRAETAYQEGLKLDPFDQNLNLDLATLLLNKSKTGEAKALILKVLSKDPDSQEAGAFLARYREQYEDKYSCSSCDRIWWVPKDIPAQSALKLRGEPPAAAPAGKCPACGKVYCVECAQNHLKEMRFFCPDCDEFLKLSDDWLKYTLLAEIEKAESPEAEG